jgi:hypothetical protein
MDHCNVSRKAMMNKTKTTVVNNKLKSKNMSYGKISNSSLFKKKKTVRQNHQSSKPPAVVTSISAMSAKKIPPLLAKNNHKPNASLEIKKMKKKRKKIEEVSGRKLNSDSETRSQQRSRTSSLGPSNWLVKKATPACTTHLFDLTDSSTPETIINNSKPVSTPSSSSTSTLSPITLPEFMDSAPAASEEFNAAQQQQGIHVTQEDITPEQMAASIMAVYGPRFTNSISNQGPPLTDFEQVVLCKLLNAKQRILKNANRSDSLETINDSTVDNDESFEQRLVHFINDHGPSLTDSELAEVNNFINEKREVYYDGKKPLKLVADSNSNGKCEGERSGKKRVFVAGATDVISSGSGSSQQGKRQRTSTVPSAGIIAAAVTDRLHNHGNIETTMADTSDTHSLLLHFDCESEGRSDCDHAGSGKGEERDNMLVVEEKCEQEANKKPLFWKYWSWMVPGSGYFFG